VIPQQLDELIDKCRLHFPGLERKRGGAGEDAQKMVPTKAGQRLVSILDKLCFEDADEAIRHAIDDAAKNSWMLSHKALLSKLSAAKHNRDAAKTSLNRTPKMPQPLLMPCWNHGDVLRWTWTKTGKQGTGWVQKELPGGKPAIPNRIFYTVWVPFWEKHIWAAMAITDQHEFDAFEVVPEEEAKDIWRAWWAMEEKGEFRSDLLTLAELGAPKQEAEKPGMKEDYQPVGTNFPEDDIPF